MAAEKDVARQTKVAIGMGVLALCAVAYLLYSYFAPAAVPQSHLNGIDPNRQGEPTEETPQYSQVLREYNDQKAQDALSGGSSYISVPSTRVQPVEPVISEETKEDPTAGSPQVSQQVAATYYVPQQAVYVTQAPPVQPDQIKALLEDWTAPTSGVAIESKDSTAFSASMMPARQARDEHDMTAKGGQRMPVAQRAIVGGFETIPAILLTAIDTDENSVVEASIPSGPYAGALVRAAGYKRVNESVDMTFTEMWFNNHMYKILAKPVDQETGRTALSGDVNRRWFERIILPAFAKGLGATAQKFENTGTTAVTTPLGGVVQTFPDMPSVAAVAGTLIAGLGGQAGDVLVNDASQIPQKQVLVEANSVIGIKFLAPVFASDEIGADKTSSGGFNAQALDALSLPASQPSPPPTIRAPSQQQNYWNVAGPQACARPPCGYAQPY